MSNRKDFIIRWLLPLASAVVVGGLFLFWLWPTPGERSSARVDANTPVSKQNGSNTGIVARYSQSEATSAQTGANNAASAQPRFSSQYVALEASRDGNKIRIDLDIKKHWHVNANPASFDFLIPTQVKIEADGRQLPLDLDFPVGHKIDAGLGKPVRVYSGQLELTARLAGHDSDRPLQAQAHVQACNDSGLCLPPSTLTTPVTRVASTN